VKTRLLRLSFVYSVLFSLSVGTHTLVELAEAPSGHRVHMDFHDQNWFDEMVDDVVHCMKYERCYG
jgi:hypothetical protein